MGVTAGAACIACQSPLIAVSEPENLVGTVIDGRFEIVDRLGAGGMGTVYRAKQRSIGRDVALKVIDRLFQADLTAVKRFMREAQVASALVHPNTVGVIEFGQSSSGRLYLVMELVRGKTLKDAAMDGPLELSRVLRIGVQLCDALEAAHALGIIHRDLKLENVMLLDGPNERDHVKILDFGLARRTVEDSRATATGLIAGTPRYLAPEVALGNAEPAPPQDIYALGVVLGEIATGGMLWEGPTLEALFAAKLSKPPKVESLQPALRSLVLRLLDRDPANRPTAGATRDALLAIGTPLRNSPMAFSHTITSPLAAATPVVAGPPVTIDLSVVVDQRDSVALPPPNQPPIALGSPAALGTPRAVGMPIPLDAFTRGQVTVSSGPTDSDPGAPPAAAKPLTAAAFEPPQADSEPLEVDAEWEREKAAKADFANRPPPRRSFKLWGVVVAVAMVAVVATVVVTIGTSAGEVPPPRPHQLQATPNTVTIEVRTRPPGQIRIDGHHAGTAPITLHVPKSVKSMEISTTLRGQSLSRTITPDRDQTVDFSSP